jgi:hypothetical protein
VTVDAAAKKAIGKETLEWSAVAKEIVASREKMQSEIEKIDFEEALASMLQMWHIDTSKLVDV